MCGEALSPETDTDQGRVLLFNETVVIPFDFAQDMLLLRATAQERSAVGLVGGEALEVCVHELRAVVGVDF